MNKSKPKIDILLALYNSSQFLDDLIQSIIKQSYTNWRLIVRDDGSTDNTQEIIKSYQENYPEQFEIIDNRNEKNLGPKLSFSELLKNTSSEYIMFCDHDDVWFPNKIELTLKKMLELEVKYPLKPLLVHTDLVVVDQDLNLLYPSFIKRSKLNPSFDSNIYYLAVSNVATGCTVMINRQAKEISCPIPTNAIMHDWWISLNVSFFGKIGYIAEPTLFYRQHAMNNVGAKKINFSYYLNRMMDINKTIKENISMYKMIKSLNFKLNPGLLVLAKLRIIVYKNFHF
jgi:glycosyltransferase involved in cell wall biosynthesis